MDMASLEVMAGWPHLGLAGEDSVCGRANAGQRGCASWIQIVLHLLEVGERGRGLAAVARLACELAQVLGRVRREQAEARGILERHHALKLAQKLLREKHHIFPPVFFRANDNLPPRIIGRVPMCEHDLDGRGST